MNAIKDFTNTVKDQVDGGAVKTFVLTYGLAFVLALCAIGLALTFRDKNTGKFGTVSYAIGLLTPSVFLVLSKWLRGMKIDVEALGSFHRALAGATILVGVLMFTFESLLGPVLAKEAATATADKPGLLTAIMFFVPKLIAKDKAEAAIGSLGYSGGGRSIADDVARGNAGGSAGGADTAETSANSGGGIGDDVQKLIAEATELADAGVGGMTDEFFMSLQS